MQNLKSTLINIESSAKFSLSSLEKFGLELCNVFSVTSGAGRNRAVQGFLCHSWSRSKYSCPMFSLSSLEQVGIQLSKVFFVKPGAGRNTAVQGFLCQSWTRSEYPCARFIYYQDVHFLDFILSGSYIPPPPKPSKSSSK